MASPSWASSLNEELVFLLTQHPRIKSAQRDLLGSDEGMRGAVAGYYPQLSIDTNYGLEYTDSPSRRLAGSHPSRLWRDTRGMTITQNIFDGFRRESNIEGARINRVLSGLALETTRQSLAFEGARTYIDVMRYARLIEIAFNNESTVQRQLNLEDERVQRGAGISTDVLQAKSRLQGAKERRVGYEGSLREAVARYMQLFGHEPSPGIMEDPILDEGTLPKTKDEALKRALANSPQIAFSGRQIDFQETRRDAAAADYFPRIDIIARGVKEDNIDGVLGERSQWSVLVQGRWQLFNGFQTQAAVAEASYRSAASRDNLTAVTREIGQEIEAAWSEIQTSKERVSLNDNGVALAAELFDAKRRQRDVGRANALEVLDAENELYNARINLVSSTFDGRRAVYRLLQAMGDLTPKTLGFSLGGGAEE
ncbi:MAG: TolC family outer membrane protein [Proteobacteria bacterium]|nr:TolC family outer membrane protein [Pseudomonadota bacterium]